MSPLHDTKVAIPFQSKPSHTSSHRNGMLSLDDFQVMIVDRLGIEIEAAVRIIGPGNAELI